jgi:hypothetical protein
MVSQETTKDPIKPQLFWALSIAWSVFGVHYVSEAGFSHLQVTGAIIMMIPPRHCHQELMLILYNLRRDK